MQSPSPSYSSISSFPSSHTVPATHAPASIDARAQTSHDPSIYHGRPNDMRGPMDWNRYWCERMSRELDQREYSASTRGEYLAAVGAFLAAHRCAPSTLRPDAIGRYLLRCKEEQGRNPQAINLILAALVFFYERVVKAPYCIAGVPRVQEDRELPDVLGPRSAKTLIDGTANEMHRLALSLAYACGLRVTELSRLKWIDLDSERAILRVRKSKGGKDRVLPIPATLMTELNAYRKHFQPITYVFESGLAGKPLSTLSIQGVFEKACGKNRGHGKDAMHSPGRSHSVRPLEAGRDLRFIQAWLGHGGGPCSVRP